MLIIMLLLASKVLLITGYHELHEIEALKLKVKKLEDITQTQNEKIASLNVQLQVLQVKQNGSDSQQQQLENLQKETHSLTEKSNNMQKDIQKNQDDITKLNRGLITYRTWGTHCKYKRTCMW